MFKIWLYYLFLARSDVQKQSRSDVQKQSRSDVQKQSRGMNNHDVGIDGINNNFQEYHVYSGLSFVER